ncbi:acetyl-CoA carboxylase biotin carboxylase subunit [Alkalihalobacterium alkalinitrilicum]|uniref:acetyl-CoA carboxylase biotin carboxylase subunit n=1 Tax=Alkalihalobacterium alkalinitrilicum TaxID=427920 RepID=UPI000994E0C0|nr:acetyl-CoA carboxylase biotin carboxylase subunit [Alkalihalobacterium alkalinitrilicum]
MNFQKILIANRGEIAIRIIRTCKKMSIKTVAIYSEADKDMPYVYEADEAVLIGPPQVSLSYLNSKEILSVAKRLKVDAIHPGYGFLSENAEFRNLCEEEGISFIGPTSDVITSMGSKIEARRRMSEASVPVVPGWNEPIQSMEEALEIAQQIGYPLMLKASAGGGGIGMSLIHSKEQLEKAFETTRNRSQNYFGNSEVFLEKYINNPRHIEVQIAADHYNNIVHLYERECSVQRRNQKVIEESPSPFLNDAQREQLMSAAIKGAKAIGYRNLGTMEFIFDEDGSFYFLEMNTRLQVEHPVTEMNTKLDLVEWQIRIAQGEKLPCLQSEINSSGHSIECRVYAEDPVNFYPSPGTISKLNWPNNLRIDTSIIEGSTITPYYDPMIAKVIVHAEQREQSIKDMENGLLTTKIEGIKTNIPLLIDVLRNDEFKKGEYTTKLIEEMKVNS